MKTTIGLLERLREPNPASAWSRFVDLYAPLLFVSGRRLGLAEAEAVELARAVLLEMQPVLFSSAGRSEGSFRNWLCEVLLEQHGKCGLGRSAERTVQEEVPPTWTSAPEAGVLGEQDYQQYLVGRALELLQGEIPAVDWRVCWDLVVCDRSAAEVAVELGISPAAVHGARYRVLRQLRNELAGLLD